MGGAALGIRGWDRLFEVGTSSKKENRRNRSGPCANGRWDVWRESKANDVAMTEEAAAQKQAVADTETRKQRHECGREEKPFFATSDAAGTPSGKGALRAVACRWLSRSATEERCRRA
jgi:hypothetical protein